MSSPIQACLDTGQYGEGNIRGLLLLHNNVIEIQQRRSSVCLHGT